MRRLFPVALLAALAAGNALLGQTTDLAPAPIPAQPSAPQSARQALIEMFTGKGANDFARHLPERARQELIRQSETPDTSVILRISMIGRQITAQGDQVQIFDSGPTLLLSEQKASNERFEVNVEHDSLLGEDDEIELSFAYYKNGQPQSLPVIPRLTFTLRQENDVWRLVEVLAAADVPLTDPDYLNGLRKQQDEANEQQVQTRMNTIARAEMSYMSRHPDLGYSCSLQNLFAPGQAADGDSAALFDPGQGASDWSDYHFSLNGCEGTPSLKFRITAEPADPDPGLKTFCSDESGQLKFVEGEKSSTCFGQGRLAGGTD